MSSSCSAICRAARSRAGARDVSANGLVVVGRGFSDRWREAFRWEDGVMESLGRSPGQSHR